MQLKKSILMAVAAALPSRAPVSSCMNFVSGHSCTLFSMVSNAAGGWKFPQITPLKMIHCYI
jgi:hypothetical protein